MIEAGIYNDMTSEIYHGDKDSISRSSLMDFKRNKRKYWAKHLDPNRPPAETKDSWIFGTAFHTLILEPHLFEQNYFIMPKKVLKRDNEELFNVHKQAEKDAETTLKQVLSLSEYEKLLSMREAIFANERARKLVENAVYEQSYFWRCEHSGLMLKARPDISHSNIIVDLKTIDEASESCIQRDTFKYGYNIQMAMIRDGVEILTGNRIGNFVLLCVEKTYPYCIGIAILDLAVIEHAHIEYKNLLLDMKECRESNQWDDYPVITISLPGWMK